MAEGGKIPGQARNDGKDQLRNDREGDTGMTGKGAATKQGDFVSGRDRPGGNAREGNWPGRKVRGREPGQAPGKRKQGAPEGCTLQGKSLRQDYFSWAALAAASAAAIISSLAET